MLRAAAYLHDMSVQTVLINITYAQNAYTVLLARVCILASTLRVVVCILLLWCIYMETRRNSSRQKQFLPQDQTPNHEHKEIQTSRAR